MAKIGLFYGSTTGKTEAIQEAYCLLLFPFLSIYY